MKSSPLVNAMLDTNTTLSQIAKAWCQQSTPPLQQIKKALAAFNKYQSDFFFINPRNAPVKQLVTERSAFIDQLLALCWHHLLRTEKACLIAVGGYGRRELFPASDIDLLILCHDLETAENNPNVAAFVRLLWDVGLNIGSSVRDISNCRHAIQEDITFATAVIEAHFIAGDWDQFTLFRQKAKPDQILSSQYFYETKRAEQKTRYLRYEETGYNVEPNLKENPGGLRDIQLVLWIAKFYFASQNDHDFIAHGYLTEGEQERLQSCLTFLSIARYGLHVICGRDENRLLFEHQRKLSDLMGYKDSPSRLAVESFMHRYYRSLREVQILTELILLNFNSAMLDQATSLAKRVNARFQIRNHLLECTSPHTFSTSPSALLEVFLILQRHPELEGISAPTIRQIHHNLHLIDEPFRQDLRNQSLFLELLKQPHSITRVFRQMHKHGILAAYVHDFKLIQGLMQFDLFHVYTVDQHTIMTIRNVRRFFIPEFAHEHAIGHEISHSIAKPAILYLACFFHDIAKGRGGQHEVLGAKCVEIFCQTHRMNRNDTHLCSWLVLHHLALSTVAQKQDINDPRVIESFSENIPNTEYLDMLYLLTIADIKATSPTLWNHFKNALLTRLWQSTRQFIQNRGEAPLTEADIISNTQQESAAQLSILGFQPQKIMKIWERLPEAYFLSHLPEQITWQASYLGSLNRKTIISCRTSSDASATELFIYCPSFPYQIACIANVLDKGRYRIMAANIIRTQQASTLMTLTLLNEHQQPIASQNARRLLSAQIRKALRALQMSKLPPESIKAPPVNRRAKHLDIKTHIEFLQHLGTTRLHVTCLDRPSLLSRIALTLRNLEVLIIGARITTVGAKAEDVFTITDRHYQPITDTNQHVKITQELTALLD